MMDGICLSVTVGDCCRQFKKKKNPLNEMMLGIDRYATDCFAAKGG